MLSADFDNKQHECEKNRPNYRSVIICTHCDALITTLNFEIGLHFFSNSENDICYKKKTMMAFTSQSIVSIYPKFTLVK